MVIPSLDPINKNPQQGKGGPPNPANLIKKVSFFRKLWRKTRIMFLFFSVPIGLAGLSFCDEASKDKKERERQQQEQAVKMQQYLDSQKN